jgi:hypothetical protein
MDEDDTCHLSWYNSLIKVMDTQSDTRQMIWSPSCCDHSQNPPIDNRTLRTSAEGTSDSVPSESQFLTLSEHRG